MDETLYIKVFNECKNNLKLAERRFLFLKKMRKDKRPINHCEAVETWSKAIEDYKASLNIR